MIASLRDRSNAGRDPGLRAVGEEGVSVEDAQAKALRKKRRIAARQAPRPLDDEDDNVDVSVPEPAGGAAPAVAAQVRPAAMHLRHWIMLASFFLLVLLPLAGTVAYLYVKAADQYHSELAFSIRSEEMSSAAAGLIGALTQIKSGTASDTDILFEYIRSQKIVEDIDAELDLRAIYNKAEEQDPFFTLGENDSIEALHAQWNRMVDVSYESATGIIHVRSNAFTPEDARAISRAILARSDALVNELSEQARGDAIRYARQELDETEASMRGIRETLTDFRRENRIVDPSADIAGQMGLLNALQVELAQALVDRDMLLSYAGDTDQRVIQANRRIEAVETRIDEERADLNVNGAGASLSDVLSAYEGLLVDLEFANASYTQALAALSAARAEARRQSRYLAPHIQPTLAQSALYPRRFLLSGLVGLFLLLGWSVMMLVYYNVRDNR